MSMGEIIIILIVAVLVLGPEKLPSTAVQIAKILKALKRQVDDAKESIEKEIRVSEIKKEADKYKNEFSEYNQNIRKKLSFEEFDELKKEITADTNAIKEDISAIEKDLASLGGGEKSENLGGEKGEQKVENLSGEKGKKKSEILDDVSEKKPQKSPQNSAILSANDNLKENEPHMNSAQNANKSTKNSANSAQNSSTKSILKSSKNSTPQTPQKDKKSNKSIKNSPNSSKNSKTTAKNSTTKKSASAKTSTAKKSKSKVENV